MKKDALKCPLIPPEELHHAMQSPPEDISKFSIRPGCCDVIFPQGSNTYCISCEESPDSYQTV